MAKIYLVDASIYIFRAWYSFPDSFFDVENKSVNAVYGFTHFLLDLLTQERPSHIAVCFDKSLDNCFRNKIYPEYKANREPAPPELLHQFKLCSNMCKALGLKVFSSTRYEADDLIGSLATRFGTNRRQVVIVSRDKDMMQLLRPDDLMWNYGDKKITSGSKVKSAMGVHAHQVTDLLALTGDKVDNVPGVPGIGPAGATELLKRFGTLQAIYENINQITNMNLRGAARVSALLEQHQELALLSHKLVTIKTDVPLRVELGDLKWQGVKQLAQVRVFKKCRFENKFKNLLSNIKYEQSNRK